MNDSLIQDLISALGFAPELLNDHIWNRKYAEHAGYQLSVDFQNRKISYSAPLAVGDETTSHFGAPENFVVLECVCRLLEKGYAPQHIALERKYRLGHSGKSGKADITVLDHQDRALVVIECKTWGGEYDRALKQLHADGGQLFSYLKQDDDIRWLCLYASRFESGERQSVLSLIQIEDRPEVLQLLEDNPDELAYKTANDAKKLHEVWRDQYSSFSTPNGLFDAEVSAYKPKKIAIKRRDLKPFADEEGRRFFNEFAEILRHNNISDKSNAFNRILSLVLCKIVDEQKKPEEVTGFQIADIKESAEAIQDRLQRLYADGMGRFLREKIVYYSDEEIDKIMSDFPRQHAKDEIARMFRAQKYYSNNEFAFKEVHNEKLFLENARVLNEIIQLLQHKQFRYARRDSSEYKAQKRYLGEFFELLLAAGYKQDEGQFFTPLPIAHFIVSSLPLSDIMARKLEEKRADFLPTVMDYACGSGHFLIEAIDQIQTHLDALETDYSDEINLKILQWQESDWTDGFIFGVEKDYRLARTAKLACFMNGDGEARITFGDGLEDYSDETGHFPKTFDVVVANPPYSIKGFKTHTQQSLKRNKFELMDALTPDAREIETLFVERLKQLLHPGGVCGVVLPAPFLNNPGNHERARALLLRHFEVRAVVELGSKTFMATDSNTVVFFLKRREEKYAVNAAMVAEDLIIKRIKRNDDFTNNEAILEAYAQTLGFTLVDYQNLLAGIFNSTITDSDWYIQRRTRFEESLEIQKIKESASFVILSDAQKALKLDQLFAAEQLPVEKEKFEIFQLVWRQRILFVATQETVPERRNFLGYEFKSAKGDEGIVLYE